MKKMILWGVICRTHMGVWWKETCLDMSPCPNQGNVKSGWSNHKQWERVILAFDKSAMSCHTHQKLNEKMLLEREAMPEARSKDKVATDGTGDCVCVDSLIDRIDWIIYLAIRNESERLLSYQKHLVYPSYSDIRVWWLVRLLPFVYGKGGEIFKDARPLSHS